MNFILFFFFQKKLLQSTQFCISSEKTKTFFYLFFLSKLITFFLSFFSLCLLLFMFYTRKFTVIYLSLIFCLSFKNVFLTSLNLVFGRYRQNFRIFFFFLNLPFMIEMFDFYKISANSNFILTFFYFFTIPFLTFLDTICFVAEQIYTIMREK